MTRSRLLTLTMLWLAVAFASTLTEAASKRIHVTALVVQQAFIGDPAMPQIGDRLITSVELFDDHQTQVGTGGGVCTVVTIPPLDPREECLLTAAFAEGQISFGGLAPLAEVGAVARFGIMGGTDDFRKARGDAILVISAPDVIDVTLDLDLPVWP